MAHMRQSSTAHIRQSNMELVGLDELVQVDRQHFEADAPAFAYMAHISQSSHMAHKRQSSHIAHIRQ